MGLEPPPSFFLYLCLYPNGAFAASILDSSENSREAKEKGEVVKGENSLTIQGVPHTPPRLSLLGLESALSGAHGLPFKSLHTLSFSGSLPPSGSILGLLHQNLRCQIYQNK